MTDVKDKKNIHDGTRTRNPQIRSLMRYPIALHGRMLYQGLEPWATRLKV